MRATSASGPARQRRHPRPPERTTIHHAAGISQKMHMTGQTGSGQARLTLGGSIRRCPRDKEWSPAERFASGSAPHAHHALGATRPSSEKQSVPRSCPSAPPAFASTVVRHRGHPRRIQIQLAKKRKSLQGVRRQLAPLPRLWCIYLQPVASDSRRHTPQIALLLAQRQSSQAANLADQCSES